MKSVGEVIKDNYYLNKSKLEEEYNNSLNNNLTFKKIVNKLKLTNNYLMKYTSKIEDSAKELDNCKKCKNLQNWLLNYYLTN